MYKNLHIFIFNANAELHRVVEYNQGILVEIL